MAGNNPPEGLSDDFFEQILAVPESYAVSEPSGYVGDVGCMPIGLQLGSGSGHGSSGSVIGGGFRGINGIGIGMGMDLPLGMNLEQGFLRQNHNRFRNDFEGSNSNNINHNNSNTLSSSAINERDSVHMSNLFPAFGHLQNQSLHLRPRPPPPPPRQPPQQFHNHHTTGSVSAAPQPPAIRPRARARRGQATDPHSIAERVRRERIAERMRALQELVPSCNKTDRGAMLDEIVDYVNFLRLQVKVLSMSRHGGAGAVAQLVADVPLSSVEGIEIGSNEPAWDKWSSDGTEQEVAKLMEEDVGAAMQFLQSKALCIMPVSLSSAIFRTRQSDTSMVVKPESNNSS